MPTATSWLLALSSTTRTCPAVAGRRRGRPATAAAATSAAGSGEGALASCDDAHRLGEAGRDARAGVTRPPRAGGRGQQHQPGARQGRDRRRCAGQLEAVHARHARRAGRRRRRRPAAAASRSSARAVGPSAARSQRQAPGAELVAEDHAVGLVVVDHQHPQPGGGTGRQPAGGDRPAWRSSGRVNQKVLPRPGTLSNAELPAHGRHQPAGDGQAEPGAAEAPGGRRVGLGERLEQAAAVGLGDADPGVGHLEADGHDRRRTLGLRARPGRRPRRRR